MPRKKLKPLQSVKGMHDILPEEQIFWDFILKKSRSILNDYGFSKIETPILEDTDLFLRSLGEATDIMEKEMYSFKTKGGDEVALRPEGTAPVARAYIEHGMGSLPHPVKLYYYGPMFRHDQPQAGRYRQFHQFGIEMIGDESAAADAEVIFVLYKVLENLGFKNLTVQINSIGDQNCLPGYLKALKEYYKPRLKKVCVPCRAKFKSNPLRMLDCVEQNCKEVAKEAPQIVDYLDEDCKKHFKAVLEFLDETGIPYILNSHLVRGLDYYTRTAFEIWPEEGVEVQSALAGGGRYDKLIAMLGGHKTPACGWALGIERLIIGMKAANIRVPEYGPKPKIFLAQLGDLAKKRSLVVFEEFRRAGVAIQASFGRDSIKSQLRIANRVGVKFTLILGQKEAIDGNIILRDMESSIQETLRLDNIVEEVKKRLREK